MNHRSISLSVEFDSFLQISSNSLELVRRYYDVLISNADDFGTVFYDYLFQFPSTAKLLEAYQSDQGDIGLLIKKQVDHLHRILSLQEALNYSDLQKQIGRIHYQRNIDPVWIMGAYHLYQRHILSIVMKSPLIEAQDRTPLMESITKLLFRDMGMMLEGYWRAGTQDIEKEKEKVDVLQQQISSLLKNLPQVIWSIDVVNNVPLYVSPTIEEISPINMRLPIPCLTWTVSEDRPKVIEAWNEALTGKQVVVESRVHGPHDTIRWFRRTFYPFSDSQGEVVRIDGVMEEITEAKYARDRLERLATTDELTGLANRALWYDRVHQALAISERNKSTQVALLLLDLNHFKYINDTLGHFAGDVVLEQVASRLRKCLRSIDTLARLGGDEFAILLPMVEDGKVAAEKVSKKVIECFHEPYVYESHELYVGVAIGISTYPDCGEDASALIKHADIAMYASKKGGIPYQYFEQGLEDNYSNQVHIMSQLKNSLRNNEFVLHYQPKVDLLTNTICGMEALIRWHHPEKGLLSPDQFIPVSEQMGFIHDITDWVLCAAIKQSQAWRESGVNVPVAVNVSARSFQDPKFIHHVREALQMAGATPECLELEITENTLMNNIEFCADNIKQLSDMGISIAIDDFGTGYSSLSYLKRLPIHQLKIDKSFIQNMDRDKDDSAIVLSVIELGHNLGLKVVAEGVERQESMLMLKELGCDAVQGFHIGHPMDHASLTPWLKH